MPDISTYNGIDMGDIASINGQDAPSGGSATASTTPTISVAGGTFGVVAVTVTNHASAYTNPNYSVSAAVGGTTTVADSVVDHSLDTGSDSVSANMTFIDSNAATGTRTVTVKAQEFGQNVESAGATATYNVSGVQNTFVRLKIVTSSGAATASWGGINELAFYEGSNGTGTKHPAANMTSLTEPSSNNMEVLTGHVYGTGYPAWKATDGSVNTQCWWPLSTAANNYYQVEFTGTVPEIASISYRRGSNDQTGYFRLLGSNTGAFAGEETDYGVFGSHAGGTTYTIG